MKKQLGMLAALAMMSGLGSAQEPYVDGIDVKNPMAYPNYGSECFARRRPSFVGNMGNQRKRRKAIRQNPSLLRKYK